MSVFSATVIEKKIKVKPPSLTCRKFPNVTFYPVEQTPAETQICGIGCESEVGVPHNSDFQLPGAAAPGFRPERSCD